MSRKYKFRDQEQLYFISFAVVFWIDVFVREEYKELLLDSIRFCQREKGLEIYAWCIMTSHVHLIIGSNKNKMEDIIRDLKSHTFRQLKQTIKNHPQESRKEWMLWMMKRAGLKNINNKEFQFWQQHNQPLVLDTNKIIENTIDYIHNNPVAAGFVDMPIQYKYSSARDYCDEKGLLDIILIE
jgi:REP element-mobilizing transposase RayT